MLTHTSSRGLTYADAYVKQRCSRGVHICLYMLLNASHYGGLLINSVFALYVSLYIYNVRQLHKYSTAIHIYILCLWSYNASIPIVLTFCMFALFQNDSIIAHIFYFYNLITILICNINHYLAFQLASSQIILISLHGSGLNRKKYILPL